jgi:hypothetical protein
MDMVHIEGLNSLEKEEEVEVPVQEMQQYMEEYNAEFYQGL